MTTLTLNLRGTKDEIIPKIKEALDIARKERSKLMIDILESLECHVEDVQDKDIITFSIRGQLVVQHLKRNHEKY